MMQKFLSFFSIIFSFLLAILIIRSFLSNSEVKTDLAGLGFATVPYFPFKHNLPIQIDSISSFESLKENVEHNGAGKELILWLGNSQIFGINQYVKGNKNSTEILFDTLASYDKFVTAYAIPNANLEEHYVLFKYIVSQLPVKFLIIPVFFDDTRESGLRDDLVQGSIKNALHNDFDSTAFGKSLAASFLSTADTGSNADIKALNHTSQEWVEKYLNARLSEHSAIWEHRGDIRSNLIYNYLFKLRNSALNINPDTKRRRIDARYEINIEAFKRICHFANMKNIKVLVYIPPIRNDVQQPYIESEYNSFKNDIEKIQSQYGYTLVNAESLIPAKYWGMKDPTTMTKSKLEVDFMHFQERGHQLLADTLAATLLKMDSR